MVWRGMGAERIGEGHGPYGGTLIRAPQGRDPRASGGFLPVCRGGYTIESSVESARAVVRAGALLGFFPEGSRKGPPDALQPFRGGIGYPAPRMGVPVLPLAFAGAE